MYPVRCGKGKKMAEYIDREKLLSDIEKYHLSDGKFQHWVEVQPAADVEHVIRCKDCKWYGRDKLKGGFCRKPEASMWSPGLPIDELKPDDYCSRAQRRENINGN